MFDTSKPNSERPTPNQKSVRKQNGEESLVMTTLEQLSDWIDEQLIELEARHESFETRQSIRGYFNRREG